MADLYKCLPLAQLEQTLQAEVSAHIALVRVNSDDKDTMDAHANMIQILSAEINSRKNSDTSGHAGGNNKSFALSKQLSTRCAELDSFKPGMDVLTFLRDCRNLYNWFAADYPYLEGEFCMILRSKLDGDYFNACNEYHRIKPIKKFDDFEVYMRTTYESKKTAYQIFNDLDSIERKQSESMSDFTLRVQRSVNESYNAIKHKWESRKKSVVKVEAEESKAMTAEDAFNFFGGMILLRDVKKDRETYNTLVNDLDDCWAAEDISHKASAFETRRQNSDQVLADNRPQINYNRNQNSDSSWKTAGRNRQKSEKPKTEFKQVCLYEIKGHCTSFARFKRCPYDHDPEKVKIERGKLVKVLQSSDAEKQKSGNNRGQQRRKAGNRVHAVKQADDSDGDNYDITEMSGFQY